MARPVQLAPLSLENHKSNVRYNSMDHPFESVEQTQKRKPIKPSHHISHFLLSIPSHHYLPTTSPTLSKTQPHFLPLHHLHHFYSRHPHPPAPPTPDHPPTADKESDSGPASASASAYPCQCAHRMLQEAVGSPCRSHLATLGWRDSEVSASACVRV